MKKLRLLAFLLLLAPAMGVLAQPADDLDARIEAILAGMTLEQKVGEMTQLTLQAAAQTEGTATTTFAVDMEKLREAVVDRHIGSILNVYNVAHTPEQWTTLINQVQDLAAQRGTGVPVLYGIDAVHGNNYMQGATLFPHNLALAATWNAGLVREANRITADETRAAGIPWNFSPVLDLGRQPLWSRFFETFGEDVYLSTELGRVAIEGQQNDGTAAGRLAATGKHFLGYSTPTSGKDRTPALIPDRVLHEYFVPPFRAAIDAGLLTVMINSGEINGVPVHANRDLLTGLLRDELGFEGLAVTDWEDVDKLHNFHRVAASHKEAVRMAVHAGIDMSMVPYDYSFTDDLIALVKEGAISEARIDTSVRRILRVKLQLGLFEDARPKPDVLAQAGSAASQAVSRQAAEESVVLLKNDGVLPLAKNQRVLVTGPGANLRMALHGSWTYVWQGTDERLYPQTPTFLDAVRTEIGAGNVRYEPGADFEQALDLDAVANAAREVDAVLLMLAEYPSVEQPGDIEDLGLPAEQQALVEAVRATGKPMVVVLVQNRPRILGMAADHAGAILMTNYPGPHGGTALADVLFGDVNPSGHLPFTYPRYAGSLTPYDHKNSETTGPHGYQPLYAFGHGLSYTSFAYSNLRMASATVGRDEVLSVSVTVTNTGDRPGMDVVQLYSRDHYATVTPAARRLRRFEKVTLAPGASETVTFTLPVSELGFVRPDLTWTVEPGAFDLMVADQTLTFEVR